MSERLPTYGGQAVLEGVMMRGSHSAAIAMRSPEKQIVIHQEPLGQVYRSRLVKIPFLRGLIMLWDALGLGMRALTISANLQTGEDEKLEGPALYLTLTASLVFAISLFFLLPAGVGQISQNLLHSMFLSEAELLTAPADLQEETIQITEVNLASERINIWSNWIGNLIEGFARLMILIGYIYLVGKIPEIKRVFMYHGAEHKTINAFESNAELTVENVARFPLEHPRCGTSFLLTLVLLSIILFTLLGPLPLAWRLVSRILFIPILAGLAYEFIRWTANHLHWLVVRWLIKPNLALQRLTTREPTSDMLEVSIAAFNAMRTSESEAAVT
jgi:uncharacterized protein YqhQ